MPDRDNAEGRGRSGGHGHAGKNDDGGMGAPEDRGRSDWSPGHQKKAAGEGSARDFAPGHEGDAPGELGRDRGENATETPEPDSLEREG